MKIDTCLYKGFINSDLRCSFIYQFEQDGQFQTIKTRPSGNVGISPSFGISISEGYDKNRIYMPAARYYPFATLLDKTVKLVSENLYEIFPDVNNTEFEIDSRALERFQTEKAMSTAGFTMVPAVWVNETSQCFPGIRISQQNGFVVVPLEDAIPMSKMFLSFDPHNYALSMLRILGKIE